ncbi:MFS transporter [Paracraurococcus lichenis]|uniref:MFS transporter n=1 Tax=Paracraurococcus lichenis TaxID=3064888 RepID=A0ABT9DY54_9PROT|nr:MFS transporter [Paracraurococcus sp. LOR1-02]MDO9708842.1 MFS transporter [Paracraurococcus sp. LOR1-02]
MPEAAFGRTGLGLAAVTVLNLPLGTVYAFSVFIRPLEAELGLSRAALSFVFGLTLVGFTAGMNLAPLLYRAASAAVLTAGCAAFAAFGMALAASATGLVQLALGYGVLFGLGGGAAYVVLLQGMNLMLGGARRGLANGFIVSLYPMGAMIGAPLFGWALGGFGLRATLGGLAAALLGAGLLAALLARLAGMRLEPPAGAAAPQAPGQRSVFWRIWLVFFLAAAAGLTVLGQAAGMVEAYGGSTALALSATTAITGFVAGARIVGGWLADRIPAPRVLAFAHLLALGGGVVLLAFPAAGPAVVSLAMIGMGYGLVSGSTAAAIGIYWGAAAYGRMAGRLYAAWCVAAVTLPVLAGRLFDLTGGYAGTLAIAATGNLLAAAIAASLPRRQPVPAPA